MQKYIFKKDTMNESQLQSVYIHSIYARDSKVFSDKGFVNIDNGIMRGTQWTCFYIKETNPITLIISVDNQMNFYQLNYLNHYYIIISKYKI